MIENQPGAGGIVGVQTLTRAAPDGMTLSVVSNNVVIFPSVYKTLPFELPGDITPIAIVGFTPIVLVVNPKVAATNAKELIALLKAQPGKINYGSSGNGTILHLACRAVSRRGRRQGDARAVQGRGADADRSPRRPGGVRHRGAAERPAAPRRPARCGPSAWARPSACRRRRTSRRSSSRGCPGYVVEAWFAVIGPKGMSAADVKHVHDAVVAAFADPAVKEAMAKQGNVINVSTSDYAKDFFRTELAKYAAIVKKAGVEPQ